MTVGWVAASTRGRALVGRIVGTDRARTLVALDWPEARQALASTGYGRELAADATRPEARHAAMEATSWQLRVLAGWLPPGQGRLARLFAAPLEIANIELHLASLDGERRTEPALRLGSLATAWPQVARCRSTDAVRTVLTTSVWGDPGGGDRASFALGLRLGWARRLAGQSPVLERWAKGGAAVLVARERFAFERELNHPASAVADTLLGRRWRTANSLAEFRHHLTDTASWSLVGVEDPADLWRAEAAVARRVEAESVPMAASSKPDRSVVIGIMALMLTDLRRVLAIVELAGRGPDPVEVFDAVA